MAAGSGLGSGHTVCPPGKDATYVCGWPASYYADRTRKWINGQLSVLADGIAFEAADQQCFERVIRITFYDVVEVKKGTTGFVFGAIIVIDKGGKKFWFASMADREGVYDTMSHFWRLLLLNEDRKVANGNTKVRSQGKKTILGQQLLGSVTDSHDTLSQAAVKLHNQGQQFNNMLGTMDDIHNDLGVCDNLVNDIDSWCGRWRLPVQFERIDPVFLNKSDIPEVFEYEVLITKLESGRANTKKVGSMRLCKDGITLLKMDMKIEHFFTWGNVSLIRVLTPWEINIVRRNLGKSDLVYSVVSANMIVVLRLLDKCARYKLRYETPPEQLWTVHHGAHLSQHNTVVPNTLPNDHVRVIRHEEAGTSRTSTSSIQPAFSTNDVDHIQIHQSQQVVSESEADEISRALTGLKSLALATQEEELNQIEKLDSLIPAVESANQRLSAANRKVKRLT